MQTKYNFLDETKETLIHDSRRSAQGQNNNPHPKKKNNGLEKR
jgi:hypothetical protein